MRAGDWGLGDTHTRLYTGLAWLYFLPPTSLDPAPSADELLLSAVLTPLRLPDCFALRLIVRYRLWGLGIGLYK
jgi:hypothetical protein